MDLETIRVNNKRKRVIDTGSGANVTTVNPRVKKVANINKQKPKPRVAVVDNKKRKQFGKPWLRLKVVELQKKYNMSEAKFTITKRAYEKVKLVLPSEKVIFIAMCLSNSRALKVKLSEARDDWAIKYIPGWHNRGCKLTGADITIALELVNRLM